jgi:hypothetical protein
MHLEAIERMQVPTPLKTIPITLEKGEIICSVSYLIMFFTHNIKRLI